MKRSVQMLGVLFLFILNFEAHAASKPPMDIATFRKLPRAQQVQVLEAYIQFIGEMEKSGKNTALLQDLLNQLISSAHASEVGRQNQQRFPLNGTNGPTYPNGAAGPAPVANPIEAIRKRLLEERGLEGAEREALVQTLRTLEANQNQAGGSSQLDAEGQHLMNQMNLQVETQLKQQVAEDRALATEEAPPEPVAAPAPKQPVDTGEGNEEAPARDNEYNCFFAGWPSKLSESGKCQHPKKVRELPAGCDPKLSCNPALFGDGLCVASDNYAFANCSKAFKAGNRKLEDIAAKLVQDQTLVNNFLGLMETADWVCSEGMQASKPMCKNLIGRLEAIRLAAIEINKQRESATPEPSGSPTPSASPSPEVSEAPVETPAPETPASETAPAKAPESFFANVGNTLDCDATHYLPALEAGIYEGIVGPINRYNAEVFGRRYVPLNARRLREARRYKCGPSIFFGVRGKNFFDPGVSSEPGEETSAGGAAQ